MKTFIRIFLIIGLLGFAEWALAIDNCYLFPRGTTEWVDCKERVAKEDNRMAEFNRQIDQSVQDSNAKMRESASNEDLARQIQLLREGK